MSKKVLLVNDDGIYFEGFKKTVDKFISLGYDVTVCAPMNPQSAKSHAIEIRNGILFEKIDLFGDIDAYAIDSTPADCVRFAKYYLNWDGDLVISGVNEGLNLGDDILYSGTVAAATEAAVRGYKSIALSGEVKHLDYAINMIENVMNFIEDNNLLDKWDVWSFNIPNNSKEFKIADQGDVNFDTYFKEESGSVWQLGSPHHELESNSNTDVYLIERGYITYSAISKDRTCNKLIKK